MAIRKEYPVAFTPRGLADAWDATEAFQGACKSLKDLVFDQSNPDLMTCRPGVGSPLTVFNSSVTNATFTTPTAVTALVVIGGIAFGMVSTSTYAGFDQPFAYNLVTNAFIPISGTTSVNLPSTQPTTGDWNPPSMAMIGIKLIITHPGFSGTGSNFFGVIDLTNPAAPVWSSANTATHLLPTAPTWVANFNNRAYFACGNLAYYSDVLVPLTMTNAGQAITVGDSTQIMSMVGLPVQTTSSGVVGALLIFKDFSIWQVTGDAAVTNSLSINFLSLNVGCVAPNTITQTPAGLFFIGIDGPYYVSSLGQVLPLTKDQNKLVQDVQEPFQNIITPSRSNASFTGSIYRISMYTTLNSQNVQADYWFDVTVRRWSGPHSWGYDNISAYKNYFICSNTPVGAALFASHYIPIPTTVYNDNGTQLTVNMKSCFLPKTQNINVKQVIESTVELSSQTNLVQYSITAYGENFQDLNSVSINAANPSYLWGTTGEGGSNLKWGTVAEGGSGGIWAATSGNPITYTIPWTAPLVFKKISLNITATSSYAVEIGITFFKYIDCGYTNI